MASGIVTAASAARAAFSPAQQALAASYHVLGREKVELQRRWAPISRAIEDEVSKALRTDADEAAVEEVSSAVGPVELVSRIFRALEVLPVDIARSDPAVAPRGDETESEGAGDAPLAASMAPLSAVGDSPAASAPTSSVVVVVGKEAAARFVAPAMRAAWTFEGDRMWMSSNLPGREVRWSSTAPYCPNSPLDAPLTVVCRFATRSASRRSSSRPLESPCRGFLAASQWPR